MADHNDDHSGLKTAADLAYAARAAYRVARAAAASGVYGAAVTAVKETLPFLIKILVGVVIALLVIPMVIFSALPNIFFGYQSSEMDPVIHMTEQAMMIGGAYMSLEDLESTQIDSVVTSIAAEYENGQEIDHIVVSNSMKEDDLLWIIAINSAAYQQDLNAMSAEQIRDFCVAHIRCMPSLESTMDGEGGTSTTLTIEVQGIDPEQLMEQLGFDDDGKLWARALHETLEGSDAIEKYKGFFEDYRTDYSGDNTYGGDMQHGSAHSNEIDTSHFVDPGTKNNLDLAAYAIQAWENNWGYVWGTYGNVLTKSLFDYKKDQYPKGVGNYADFIEENWLGRRTADCIGLIKGYGWLDASSKTIGYAKNGMPDYGADQMYRYASNAGVLNQDYGSMEVMPEIPGLMLWKNGHAGVYIGNGYAIEAMSTKKGVCKTKVDGRGWQGWCKLPCIKYSEVE